MTPATRNAVLLTTLLTGGVVVALTAGIGRTPDGGAKPTETAKAEPEAPITAAPGSGISVTGQPVPTAAPPQGSPGAIAGPTYAIRVGYEPLGAEPKDAIPGGSLAPHEALAGTTSVALHGGSEGQLRVAARDRSLSEISSFTDLATAERAVAEALYAAREDVGAWLLAETVAPEKTVERTVSFDAGLVYVADRDRAAASRRVRLRLAPSDRFGDGFRIVSAALLP